MQAMSEHPVVKDEGAIVGDLPLLRSLKLARTHDAVVEKQRPGAVPALAVPAAQTVRRSVGPDQTEAAIGRSGLMANKIELRNADEAMTELVDLQPFL